MAGPLNGIGGQQLPISNTFQPGGQNNGQVREREDAQPQENTVQPQGAAPAESQASDTGNQDILQSQVADALVAEAESSEPTERGSILDIEV